jgi:RNA polymerase sigma-70 factor (ECF subfamily)
MGQASAAQAALGPAGLSWGLTLRLGRSARRPVASATSALSDEALMARVQDGCEPSYDALVARHYAPVLNFAARMIGRPDLAADVAQQAFVAVYHQRSRYRRGASFRAWLYAIARRQCWRAVRSERRTAPPGVGANEMAQHADDPRLVAEQGETLAALRACLTSLPERERATVILFHYLQWPYDEIADALGCSPGAARTAACRGRARLRALMAAHQEDGR